MESVASKDVLLHQRNLEEGQDDQPDLSVSQAAEAEQLLDMEDEVVAPPVTEPAATLGQGQQESISVSKATQSMRPPSAPERDCTYIAINKYRMSDLVAPNLMGGDLLSVGECGSLYGFCDKADPLLHEVRLREKAEHHVQLRPQLYDLPLLRLQSVLQAEPRGAL